MKDKDRSTNQDLIPQRTRQNTLDQFDFSSKEPPESGRFSVLQASPHDTEKVSELVGARKFAAKRSTAELKNTGKNMAAQSDTVSTNRITGENYLKEYEKKQRQTPPEPSALTQKEIEEKRQQEKKKIEAETLLRVRARDISDQIHMWRREFGLGNYEATHINGMLAQLEQELNGIDARYWP